MASKTTAGNSRTLGVLCGYTCLFFVFLGLGVYPHLRSVKAMQADIHRVDREISTREEKQNQLKDVRNRVKLIHLKTSNYDRLVPETEDLGPFLNDLSRELGTAGMRDIVTTALPATPLGKSQRKPIEIHSKGSFAQFHDFLLRLENLKRMCSVGKVSIEADTDMSGSITASITLFIYSTNTTKTGP